MASQSLCAQRGVAMDNYHGDVEMRASAESSSLLHGSAPALAVAATDDEDDDALLAADSIKLLASSSITRSKKRKSRFGNLSWCTRTAVAASFLALLSVLLVLWLQPCGPTRALVAVLPSALAPASLAVHATDCALASDGGVLLSAVPGCAPTYSGRLHSSRARDAAWHGEALWRGAPRGLWWASGRRGFRV